MTFARVPTRSKSPSWVVVLLVMLSVPAVVVGAVAAFLMSVLLHAMNLLAPRPGFRVSRRREPVEVPVAYPQRARPLR